VNAAFLLVTTAWLAGADAAPPAAAPAAPAAPAVAPAAPCSSCANGSCGSTCSSGCCNTCCEKEHFLKRLMGHFHHKDECCDTCNTCNTCDTCDSGCGGHGGFLKGLLSKFHHKDECCDTCNTCGGSCGAATSCDCGCEKEHFLKRLMGHFHHKSDCCDTCNTCDSCGSGGCANGSCGGAGIAAPGAGTMPKAEPIAPPKTDPGKPLPPGEEGKKTGGDKQSHLSPQPIAPPPLDLTPTASPKLTDPDVKNNPF
jgi:hypothetical protein